MSNIQEKASDQGRKYHTIATGDALITVKNHEEDEDIILFGANFCPFVQRAWVAFEVLGIPYKYYEVDPYKKPQDLLEVSPKGLVPALRFNRFNPPGSLNESTVIMEYLEDLAALKSRKTILPPTANPYARALVRLQVDHVNRSLVPAFYRYLQAQDEKKQIESGKEFLESIEKLVGLLERAEREILGGGGAAGDGEVQYFRKGLGLWIPEEKDLSLTDIMAGPWLYRATIVLAHYRGFQLPPGEKVKGWLTRVFQHPAFKATCSTDQLYLDSYERYAFNRPNTSQVANAINEGRALP
ncbi:glutathione S-transferase [Crepidotus variabilis]|uniref:Glutathione S-transferase n=1 Tax=Crepidotus variabilis TaxID=179855 RepID=A0A9P6ETL1_9AGAR|nr:glutathione S-transferase [Crepidotus variabilis]